MFTFLNRIKNDEGGQGLLFAALVLLVVVAFTLTVVDVGTVVHRKVQAQTAADAAAMSGATLMARGLNIITYLNMGIAACYIMIGFTILTWVISCIAQAVPIVCIVGAIACTFYDTFGDKIIRGLNRLANLMSDLQGVLAEYYGILIGIEMYRVANKNLTNAPAAGPFPSEPINWDDISSLGTNGAIGVSGVPRFPPMLSDCVKEGTLKDLMDHFLPEKLNDVVFGDDGSVSYKHEFTRPETTRMVIMHCSDQVRCYACNRAHKNHPNIRCIVSNKAPRKGCKGIVQEEVVQVPDEKSKSKSLGDKGKAIPYQLKKGWQKAARIGALAFRLERKKAISEKLFGDRKMIRRNYTFAEAEAYQKGRRSGNLLLFKPTWQSRMKPVTMVDDLLDKFGNVSLADSLTTRLILH